MTKDQLERLKELNRLLKDADDQIARLRSQAERTTSMLDGLPKGSPMTSAVSDAAIKLITMADDLNVMKVEQQYLINVLIADALKLPHIQAKLIRLRYVDGRSFKYIAQELDCGVSNVFKLHRIAIKNLSRI